MKKAEVLLKNSIQSNLCCHCGICAGVCPTRAITCENNVLNVEVQKCVDCGLCVDCCAACGYELSDLTQEDIKEIPRYSVASKNPAVFEKASSGGFVTQALLTLLSSGEITAAAVVTTGDSLKESCAKYIVTDDASVILNARRSKYTQATIDTVISYIKGHEGKYAVVGLPCQLYGLTQAMERLPVLRNRIVYKLGLVCGYTYDETCIEGLLQAMDLKAEDVKRILGWREGGLPGNFSVECTDGRVCSLPFADEHSIDVTYYAQNRCRLCKDCLCENGDVVSADIGGWKERRTLVLVRSLTGQRLLEQLELSEDFIIERFSAPFTQTVIPFMLREKRAKVDLRLSQNSGVPRPLWIGGYSPKLLLSQKIEAQLSVKLETKATQNKSRHSAKKKRRLGHLAYHKLSERFILKVLFKLQVLGGRVLKALHSICSRIVFRFSQLFGNLLFLSKRPIRAVVIGLGRWGAQYLGFLSRSKYFKLVAAYDTDRERLHFLSQKYRFPAAENLEQLCEHYNADAVFILTPTPTHASVFASVKNYNLPIYMEKPISIDSQSAQAMVDDAINSGNLLYVAHSMKYEPAVQKIKKILLEGRLGPVTSFEFTRTVKNKGRESYANAALYQIGVHLIDVALFLFGRVKKITDRQQTVDNAKNYEDLTFQTQQGALGKIRYGFSEQYNFSLKVKGKNGLLTYADSHLTIYTEAGKCILKLPMKNESTVFSQLEEFYFAVRKGTTYLNTAQNAMEIMKLCDQIIKMGD